MIPSAEGQVFKILFFFRLLRLLRVFRLLAGSSGVHFLVSPISGPVLRVMNTATFFLLNVLFTMLVFINLLGCMWWFTAEMEGLENSWVAYAGVNFDVTTASAAAQYVTSVYFAMTIITTVGFGDITPQTVAEMLVAMVFMGVGLFYFGYIVSAVSSLVHMINAQARGTQKVRQKLEEIDMWASSRHISGHLRHQLKTYYMEVWAPHCGAQLDDSSQFQELPAALRAELVLSMSGGALRQSYMLSALDLDLVEFLATLGLPSPLIAGHDLYTEGEAASKFWVLQEGELTVMRGISKIGTIVGPAVIGQAAIFSNLLDDCQRRMHTMRAAVNCTLWEFSGSTFSYMLRYRPKVLVRLCLRYRDHLMHLKKKFRNRTPQRIDRMIERLGLIAHAISNDEPFLGAEGVELHIRDPEALDASNGSIASVESRNDSFMLEEDEDSRLGRLFDAPGGPNQKDGNDSPLREDSHNFNVSLAANRSLERMNTMIDAARAFAGTHHAFSGPPV
ncbi:MAG: ion channel [bacterium]